MILLMRCRERWTVSPSAENERPVSISPASRKNRNISAWARSRPSAMMTMHDLAAMPGALVLCASMLTSSADKLVLRSSRGSL